MKQLLRITAVAAAAAAVVLFVAFGRPESAHSGAQKPATQTITVTGTGLVSTEPDRAFFSFGVETHGETAAGALAANSRVMRAVIAAVVEAGVARKYIQTEGISISPLYANGGPNGFTAHNSVRAKVVDLDRAGAVIDAAVDAGANQVWGPSLARSDRQDLHRTALRAAFADAQAKAQALAAASGTTLRRGPTILEAGAVPIGGGTTGGTTGTVTGGGAAPPPIERGTQDIQADVTVAFSAS